MLTALLAKAESVDPTLDNLTTVIVLGGIALAASVLALVVIVVARWRSHRQADAIVAISVLWAVLATISAGSTTLAQMKYQHEHQVEFMSGYLDADDTSGAPRPPVLTWSALAAGYTGLLGWAALGSRASG
jgi:hypothetical protein